MARYTYKVLDMPASRWELGTPWREGSMALYPTGTPAPNLEMATPSRPLLVASGLGTLLDTHECDQNMPLNTLTIFVPLNGT